MKSGPRRLALVFALCPVTLLSCASSTAPSTATDSEPCPPGLFAQVTSAEVLANPTCAAFVGRVKPGLSTRGFVWSLNTPYGCALFATVNRDAVVEWADVPQRLTPPDQGHAEAGHDFFLADGTFDWDPTTNHLLFPLCWPATKRATDNSVPASQDFALFAADGQYAQGKMQYLTKTLPQVADPDGRLQARHPVGKVRAGMTVIGLGRMTAAKGATAYVTTGAVLAADVAKQVAAPEQWPFEPEAEFLVEMKMEPTMRGGPVYDTSGQAVGILAQSLEWQGRSFSRVVRLSYVVAWFEARSTPDLARFF